MFTYGMPMIELFRTFQPQPDSLSAVKELLSAVCGIQSPVILRTPQGKPYLDGNALFFSVAHSGALFAVAVSDRPVGLDAERRTHKRYPALTRRLTEEERREDLLKLWTAKEAYVKYADSTLARELPSLVYERGALLKGGLRLPVSLNHAEREGYVYAVCSGSPLHVRFRSFDGTPL